MMMPGRLFSAETGYRYGFNGKENDNEVKGNGNQQDYGMRIYDPRLSRFLSVDPISREFPWNSPYAFAENGPIENVDLDGLERAPSNRSGGRLISHWRAAAQQTGNALRQAAQQREQRERSRENTLRRLGRQFLRRTDEYFNNVFEAASIT